MPLLLVTIMAVVFASFGLLAGVNYMDPSLKSRIQTSRALSAQYSSLYSAVSSYRFENGGIAPSSLSDVDGYLRQSAKDGFGKLSQDFSWSIKKSRPGRAALCLTYHGGVENDVGVVSGLVRFYEEATKQQSGVTIGRDCQSPAMPPEGDLMQRLLETKATVAVRFQEVY